MIPRNPALEREITSLAAEAAGYVKVDADGVKRGDTRGLWEFADHRALPGGIRLDLDFDREWAEELADACNYGAWAVMQDWPGYLAGDSDACARVERRLRALSAVITAWHELHTEAH